MVYLLDLAPLDNHLFRSLSQVMTHIHSKSVTRSKISLRTFFASKPTQVLLQCKQKIGQEGEYITDCFILFFEKLRNVMDLRYYSIYKGKLQSNLNYKKIIKNSVRKE